MPGKRHGFDVVLKAARALPDVETGTAWGASSLKAGGKLLACQAIHKSAEPNSIVVKIPMDQRAELLAAEPDVYYITEHYVNYPSILVRLQRIHADALRDLLGMAWRFAHERKPARSGGRRTTGSQPRRAR
jgi:hypothetical protein